MSKKTPIKYNYSLKERTCDPRLNINSLNPHTRVQSPCLTYPLTLINSLLSCALVLTHLEFLMDSPLRYFETNNGSYPLSLISLVHSPSAKYTLLYPFTNTNTFYVPSFSTPPSSDSLSI